MLSLTIAQSIAFPTLVQFAKRRFRRVVALVALLLIFLVSYTWTGVIFFDYGLHGLLLGLAVWWLIVIVDACRLGLFLPAKGPLPVYVLGLYAAGLFGLLASLILFKSSLLGFEVFRIPSGSMLPTLTPGDFVLVDTRPSAISKMKTGEIVVFERENSSTLLSC